MIGDSEATATRLEAGDRVVAKLRSLLGLIRPEEWLLLSCWLGAYLLIYSSDTGFDFWPVFLAYMGFFGLYIVYLACSTRVAFWLAERWRPTYAGTRRLHYWVWGPSDDQSRSRLDRAIVGNERALRDQRSISVVTMDFEFVRGAFWLFANLTMYSNVKARIPFINSAVGDSWFEQLDHAIFGADAIASVERWFASSPDVAQFFASTYMHDYVWMIVLVLVLYLRRDVFGFRWLIMSVCLVYLVCVLVTVAYPSFGPCFMAPERFTWLRGNGVAGAQAHLASYYDYSISVVNAGKPLQARAFVGIAAFPSLHVGHMVILLVVALRTVPLYALWVAWVAVITSIATVGFGWHYAVDAIGGVVIAAGVTEGTYRLMRRWARLDAARRGTAAAAPSDG